MIEFSSSNPGQPSPANGGVNDDLDRTLSSRYECKYILRPEHVDAVRSYIRPFVRPDRFARRCPGYGYTVSSLYFDSADLALYQSTVDGKKSRYKLRVRTYGDGVDDRVFFEAKKRMDGIVYKYRSHLGRREAFQFYDAMIEAPDTPVSTDPDLEEFARLAQESQARPVMRVQYLREAYESAAGDPVRLTFDSNLIASVTYDFDISHSGHDWVLTPLSGTVLELKFTERYPPWVGQLVEHFELKRRSVAKYGLSMQKALLDGRCRRPVVAPIRRVRRRGSPPSP